MYPWSFIQLYYYANIIKMNNAVVILPKSTKKSDTKHYLHYLRGSKHLTAPGRQTGRCLAFQVTKESIAHFHEILVKAILFHSTCTVSSLRRIHFLSSQKNLLLGILPFQRYLPRKTGEMFLCQIIEHMKEWQESPNPKLLELAGPGRQLVVPTQGPNAYKTWHFGDFVFGQLLFPTNFSGEDSAGSSQVSQGIVSSQDQPQSISHLDTPFGRRITPVR